MTRRVALAALIALVLSGAYATHFWATLDGRLPSDDDYRQANERIRARVDAGDVIVLAPSWAERGRAFLTAAPVEAGYDLAHDEYRGTRRQWLVALADAPRFDLEDARRTLSTRGRSLWSERIGGLWVELFAIAGPAADFSFTDEAATAEVSIAGTKGEKCRDTGGGRHQCSHGPWNHVSPGWHEVDERPLRCLWAHPVDEGPLEIRYPDVPLRGVVRVRAALTDSGPGFDKGTPVELELRAAEGSLIRWTIDNRSGVQSFSLPWPESLPERGPVTFAVTSASSQARHFCFDAWVGPSPDR